MKRLTMAIVVLIASVTPSLAQDWTGFYFGGHLGSVWDDFNV